MIDVKGVMIVPGAGASEQFEFTRGGKQGGTETPDVFNAMVECGVEPRHLSVMCMHSSGMM